MKLRMFDEAENSRRASDAAVDQSWFQAIYQHAAFGISLISPDNLYLAVNPAYVRMMGYSAAELVGRPLLAITHPDDTMASNELNARMDRGEINEFTLQKRYLCRDGGEFHGRLKVSRVDDDDGRILFKLAMVENIDELKQREQALAESEARLAEAQRIANMGNWEFTVDGGKIYWSDECYRIFGQDRNAFSPSHDSFLACVHPDDREDVKRVLAVQWTPRGRYTHEHRVIRSDGEVRYVQERVVPYYDESGALLRRVGTVQDITERRRAEDALRKSERQLQQSTDNVPALIAYINKERRYHFANRTYEEWYGIAPEEIVGRTIREVLGPTNAQIMEPFVERVLTGERQDYQVSFDTANGVRRQVKGTLVPNLAEDGAVLGFHVLAQDVTQEKMAEEALRHAKEMAEEASRAKSTFLATMSHELRTPLNAIIGFSEIIAKEFLGPVGTEEYRDYAQDIHDSGGLLLGIIGEILDFSKLESGKMALSEELLDVPEIVRSCLVLVADMADRGGLTVESDLPETLPRLRADRLKLMQMLGNLLSNAAKFTESGGRIGVRARAAPESGYLFQVYDNGIGIARRDIGRALLPFEQVDNSLTRKFAGTGLGLPLCKSFAELHGGTLELTSEPGEGTTVTLRFPSERTVVA